MQNKFLICSISILVFIHCGQCFLKLDPLLTPIINEVETIIKAVPEILTQPYEFLDASIQWLRGVKPQVLFQVYNLLCTTLLQNDGIYSFKTPDIDELALNLITESGTFSFPLNSPQDILKSPQFDPTKKTVIFITGWLINIDITPQIDIMGNAYLCRNDTNFIVLDAAKYIQTLYSWSAFNTQKIGKFLGLGLSQLIHVIPPQNIQLIGHSLGSHIAGAAGQYFKNVTGELLQRITALDAASPCFRNKLKGLSKNDATFVDVLHTNPGILGKFEPIGHVDFYAGGLEPLQNGSPSIIGSHLRAVYYYAETVWIGNEHNFIATSCETMSSVRKKTCSGKHIPYGYATGTDARGFYIFEVNKHSPFGLDNSVTSSKANFKCLKNQNK